MSETGGSIDADIVKRLATEIKVCDLSSGRISYRWVIYCVALKKLQKDWIEYQ